ncbi:MAG: PAS domain-containing protein [Anaerolineae bacterium]|nr:PAS domain-containing protein [Anaerolineae bacterium]
MQYTIFLLLAPISLLVSLGVLAYAVRRRTSPEISALVALMVVVVGWLVTNTLELVAASPDTTLFWAKVCYLFIAATPVAWMAFGLQYTGVWSWSKPSVFWVLALIPATTILLLWTDAYQWLVWRDYHFRLVNGFLTFSVDYGPWFLVHTVSAYVTVALGSGAVVLYHFRSRKLYRRQSVWLLIGSLIPIVLNFVYVTRLFPGLRKDFTPIGFALAGSAFALGIFRHRLFDIRPIARATLVDSMEDPVITLDAQDRVIDLNPAASDLLENLPLASGGEELLGRDVAQVVVGWPALAAHLDRGTVGDIDMALPDVDHPRHYACRITALVDGRERQIGRLILLQDITERKLAEAELRQRMIELEISNEQLDAFAYTAAHDLKGPLSTIGGFIEMIDYYLDSLSKEEIREYLISLRSTGRRMGEIIDSLLLLARIHRQEDLDVLALNMGQIVDEALDRVSHLVIANRAEVATPETWPRVLGYAPWVTEVWVNYLTNALKYGGSPPQIALGAEAADRDVCRRVDGLGWDPERRCYRFWIRDNGQGLTSRQMSQLYRPFTRFHATPAGGHGLGLAIVQRIVDRLGGQVGVQSDVGVGSSFWFTLPAAPDAIGSEQLDAAA